MDYKDLSQNLNAFLRHIESIKDTLPMSLLLIEPHQKKANDEFLKFVNENVIDIEEKDGDKTVTMLYEHAKVYDRLVKNSEISSLASKIIPESLFVSLISQFDAYLNRLLKILFELRPEYINNSERNLTFSELVEFGSIEKAREYVIEKEIESVLRRNHSEHFEYLENKLGIPLRKNLAIWPEFIEITERRNLFVHSDGIVSNQYIKVCERNQVDLKGIKLNDRLKISGAYFNKTYRCLFELSVKLTHTIWRKLLKDQIGMADRELNNICYELINSQQYDLADVILEFATSQKVFFNDAAKNVFVINKALSKFLQSKNEDALEVINQYDWSASSDDFKLAHLVINQKYEECYSLMRKIGKDGEVDKTNYRTWPLFHKMRTKRKFKKTFKEIFEEDYKVIEIPKRPLQELIDKQIKDNPEIKERLKEGELSSKEKLEKKSVSKEPE